ncbi:MAG TPA: FkbM family methyltransferase [Pelobium sp.]|nr:FkbM family methyltransferase [Pelobium sp.]
MNKGFLFRRLGLLVPCVLRLPENGNIKLSNKHNIASFQDVYLNPFYWEALMLLNFIPKNVFDLGANFGFFTSLCHQVLSYKSNTSKVDFTVIEANINLISSLEDNLSHLTLNHQTLTILHGIAGPNESMSFNPNKRNLLASSIGENGTMVPFVDFNLFKNPDLLKVDIEGAESLLFENYFMWIKSARAIIVEFHYSGEQLSQNHSQLRNENFELALDRVEESGYRNQLWIKKS